MSAAAGYVLFVSIAASMGMGSSAERSRDCHAPATSRETRASPNDNRAPAGIRRRGQLRVRLEAREVAWYPDGLAGCPLHVHAFAEPGKAARIPGPMIRVRAGEVVHVELHNALSTPIWVRGLHDRATGVIDSVAIASGATGEFDFHATTPGAWYYWAAAPGRGKPNMPVSAEDGQLVGALVIDPAAGASHDRVFVMTRWTPRGVSDNTGYQLNAINGRSWPATERLDYAVNDSVRWHVINASDALHMMHLHGFYFHVDQRGDAAHDSTLIRTIRSNGVTTATRAGEWMSISWLADRDGQWLFHCHFVAHMSGAQRVPADPSGAMPASHTSAEGMAGLLLGIRIRSGATRAIHATGPRRRTMHLFANSRPKVYGDRAGYGFVLQTDAVPPARDSIVIPGTPIIVTRGEPVEVVVHNRTSSPFGVHWHGIELESFFDGVAGWSGTARRLAPLIAPNDSFAARFTPPRAGTFIYHVHNEPSEELASGLFGPLIVLDSGARFDSLSERMVVISADGPGVDPATAINGKANPDTIRLVARRTYRFRVIDITSNEAHMVSLHGAKGPLTWRPLARDGADVPSAERLPRAARYNTASGITRDFELTPTDSGEYVLALDRIVAGSLTGRLTVAPIHVSAP